MGVLQAVVDNPILVKHARVAAPSRTGLALGRDRPW